MQKFLLWITLFCNTILIPATLSAGTTHNGNEKMRPIVSKNSVNSSFNFQTIGRETANSPDLYSGVNFSNYPSKMDIKWRSNNTEASNIDKPANGPLVFWTLDDIGLFEIKCNNNATKYNDADDYIEFYLNPSGTDLSASYTVSVSSGTVTPTTGTYGAPTYFRLQNGSSGAGNVTITVSDAVDPGATQSEVLNDPGSCSPCINNLTYQLCNGESYTISVPAGITNPQWFKNGVAIPGVLGNANSYLVTEAGSYSFTGKDATGCDTQECCPIIFTKCVFDLALYKKLAPGQDSILAPGSAVTFRVSVVNQGTIRADNIEVTDYIPAELTLNDADWSAPVASKTTIMLNSGQELPAGGLAPGQTANVDISFTLNSPLLANIEIKNWAEISAATDSIGGVKTDIDSSPDQNQTNDKFLVDNYIDGNGKLGSDEDDHDPAVIYTNKFDLALYKKLSNGQSAMINPGDDVNFTITVVNQGNIVANNIQITDYIPSQMTLNDADWTAAGLNATKLISVANGLLPAGGLAPGSSVSIDITLKANAPLASNTNLVNWAEISSTTDLTGNPVVDFDSTPDQNNTDTFIIDDNIEGNGKNGGDEDDHDKAEVVVNPFDLALIKKLANGQSSMIKPGDDVNFTITIVNQGLISAGSITITDFIPALMTLNDVDWTAAGANATKVLSIANGLLPIGGLQPGASTTVDVTLKANAPIPYNTKIINWAEISASTDNNGVSLPDVDSTPDGTQSNDTYLSDNDLNGNGKNGGDEDDHDPAEVTVDPFDIALYKRLADGQPYMINPGDDVNFTIVVKNQGAIAADNIQLTDYIPNNMTLADTDWAAAGLNATITLNAGQELPVGGLLPGDSVSVNITLKASGTLASNIKLTNWTEISATTDGSGNPVIDIDSTPDSNKNNDTFLVDNDLNGDGKNGGDEDDHDPAEVVTKPFDLALIKKLAVGQSSMVQPGDNVNFTITITNQGLITANNIQITDYIPSELTLNDADWSLSGSLATILLNAGQELPVGGLLPGASVSVDVTFTVNAPLSANSKITNWAEISAAQDNNGNIVPDLDSNPDQNNSDNYLSDNNINGDGKNGGDEDDHDPAELFVNPFDLALYKKLSVGQNAIVNPGENVNFTITVVNQGLIPADNINLVDYIPTQMTLADADWTAVGSNASIVLNIGQELPFGGLLPGDSVKVDITLKTNAPLPANTKITNWSEIASATDQNGNPVIDIDSNPDQSNGDKFLVDNDINGNGKNGGDEDDHDPAEVYTNVFDLAMYKTLAPGQTKMIKPGEDVIFRIHIVNQGGITANNIQITDYIPAQMTLNDADWTVAGTNATIVLNAGQELPASGLAPGQSTFVDITLKANSPLPSNLTITNWAEISAATDLNNVPQVDIDSNPDGSNNDLYLSDNNINGDGKNGGDEDDHDPEDVVTEAFGLALYKKLAPNQPQFIEPGDDVNFRITVVNQGTIAADNIQLTDFIPAQMTLNDASWTPAVAGKSTKMLTIANGLIPAGGLLPGDSVFVNITLKANSPLPANLKITNWAEISAHTDAQGNPQVDVDSDPDQNNTDKFLVDNDINGNGKNGGDEDDHDPADVFTKTFDLALHKKLAPGQTKNIKPGQNVNFRITVVNQGSIAADNIQVTDYIPAQMTLNDADWTVAGTNATIVLNAGQELPAGGLAPGAEAFVDITLLANSPLPANLTITNWAEISDATDNQNNPQVDIDSNPDQSNTDKFLVDNDVNGDGKNGGDEDDHDPEDVVTEAFDLALYKKLAPNQPQFIEPGDDVNFRITVVNQGTIAADNIQLTDFIPAQMTLNDASWTPAVAGKSTKMLTIANGLIPAGGLLPGDSVFVNITLKANSPLPANLKITNWAEISAHTDAQGNPQVDVDSDPDQNNTDKFLVDNDINGNGKNGGDEDDHDPADVFTKTFDLALHKKLAPGQTKNIKPGQNVNFRITVVNQGSIAADNIQVTDYIPAQMTLNDADWTVAGTNATIVLNAGQELPAGGLAPGAEAFVDITLLANSPLPANLTITNWAEISDATDNQNNPQVDIDSNPDQSNTDKFLVDNDVNGDGKNGGDEDDHDPEDVVTEAFDLALYKKLAPNQPQFIEPGDDVNFRITVVNQGTIAADNIQLTDFIPAQMTLNDASWTPAVAGKSTKMLTIANGLIPAGGLLPGDSVFVNITLKANSPLPANLKITNWAEISAHTDAQGNPQVDVDSDPDQNNTDKFLVDNDINGNGKNGGDEDDHDPADVFTKTFDLALHKKLAPGQTKNIKPGQNVNFRITVVNQGSIAADNIQVTDYIPAQMTLNDADWTVAGTNATIVLNAGQELPAGGLAPGAEAFVDITLLANSPLPANLTITNWAEISDATDNQNNPQVDIDSNPDQSNTDKFLVDNDVNGDGKNGGDEDDHDPEDVVTEAFDLALYKKLAPNQPQFIEPGDDVNFRITVVNQGTIAADNIQLTDFIPAQMTLNDASWTPAVAGKSTKMLTIANGLIPAGGLLPGDSVFVNITLKANSPLPANLKITNWAEISAHTDAQGNPQVDVDSDPDQNNTDKFLVDNDINGNGKNGGDEDDHDPADVFTKSFDLALYKKLSPGQNYLIEPGDNVNFRITVVNQGSITADNIEITDYIPAEMTLWDSDWTLIGNKAKITLNAGQELFVGGLLPGDSAFVDITLKASSPLSPNLAITNWAEISKHTDNQGNPQVDIDSNPDDINNDKFLIDNEINGNGKSSGDEDDHDPAEVKTKVFDLALTKKLAPGQSKFIQPGDLVNYRITVINQGNIGADQITVTDYIPLQMTLADADWTAASGNTATIILNAGQELPIGGLPAGASTTVDITLKANSPLPANTSLINWAEISNSLDNKGNPQVDIDSSPDGIQTNDKFDVNDYVDGNGKNGGDEDDHDPEEVIVKPFDLALWKILAPGQTYNVEPGDLVKFRINVTNQGGIPANNIVINDYIPVGMSFVAQPNWTSVGSIATSTITTVLQPNATTFIDITLKVNNPLLANTELVNWAEIGAATDNAGNPQTDIDSTPDDNKNNDIYTSDNNIDGNGKAGQDEDDHDPASVVIKPFDLALIKELGDGQTKVVKPGENVIFAITVFNQGSIAADNIEITDYIPAGLTLNDPSWVLSGANAARVLNSGSELPVGGLLPGTTVKVTITFKVTAPATANMKIINYAEISNATDDKGNNQTDIDSTPDQNNDDKVTQDNEISGNGKNGEDEDDHDPEEILIAPFDLALIKKLAPQQSYMIAPGSLVNFRISVINQGTVTANNIEITDYIPSQMTLADADWTGIGGGKAKITLTSANGLLPVGGLTPGGIATIDITLLAASPIAANSKIVNWAEISKATDGFGNPTEDVDSNPDSDKNNDLFYNDDYIDGDGKNAGDEDDHDPAEVVVQPFDLALNKKLKAGQSNMVKPGDLVNYTINVVNQGAVPADNIKVNDYIPGGMTLSDANWTLSGTTASTTLSVSNGLLTAGGLKPGETISVNLTLKVNSPLPANESLTNVAEIASATDDKGNPQDDIDSNPDNDKNNDKFDTNDYLDGNGKNGGDEDDSDPETVYVLPFDLALYKTMAPGYTNLVEPGDLVDFRMVIVNQGAVPAHSIQVTDYIPSGLSLQDADWTLVPGSKAQITLTAGNQLPVGGLQPGTTTYVDVTMKVASPLLANSSLKNLAEISFAKDPNGNLLEDIDSNPDAINDDKLVNDNDISGDGKKGEDEDDHDIEALYVEPFDLALYKTLAPGQKATVAAGELVNFKITVVNQGTITADNIKVVDYIPAGMLLTDADWTDQGTKAVIILKKGSGLPLNGLKPGQSTSVNITMKVASPLPASMELTNWSEICSATDDAGNPQDDIDSTPDGELENDLYLDDNEINGDGKNGGDEDDHDPASVTVLPFDLALFKTLAPGQASLVEAGDLVKFRITVINQGLVDADNITVSDYIPLGLTLADATWTLVGASAQKILTKGNGLPVLGLKSGSSTTVDITLKVNSPISGDTEFINFAEVSSATDTKGNPQEDIDSYPDTNPDNDQYLDDNDVNGNGKFGEDEDDHDGAIIKTKQTFDLALTKLVLTPSPVSVGQLVTFEINVANQGKVDARNITIGDRIPGGFTFDPSDNPGWNGAYGATDVNYVFPAIDAAKTGKATIKLRVNGNAGKVASNLTNIAEITSAQNTAGDYPKDEDSSPDVNPYNDDLIDRIGANDHIDIDYQAGDEDDHDIASVTLGNFDLALTKLAPAGTYSFGSKVPFQINVANQGGINAKNIQVVDYLPAGFTFNSGDNPGWSIPVNNKTFYTIQSLNVGQATSVTIVLTVNSNAGKIPGDLKNAAEIASAQNPQGENQTDDDSTPDDENGDPVVDRTGSNDHINIDYTADDEDDHDIAVITLGNFDLALTKLVPTGIYSIGSKVPFIINVANQGSIDAKNVQVVDYIPSGLTFNIADNPGWSIPVNNKTYYTIQSLNVGQATSLTINLTINNNAGQIAGDLTNAAEISSAQNPQGQNPLDEDSTPDTENGDPLVDRTGPNDHVNIDDTADDEDDHDIAIVKIEEFDLALTKLIQGNSGNLAVGQKVTFLINVANQGTIDARNITINDYVPAGFTFFAADNIGWNGANFATVVDRKILILDAGKSFTYPLVLTVNNSATNGNLTNIAEITDAENTNGEKPKDSDSTPDKNPNNDPVIDKTGPDDHTNVDNQPGDEDDHDIAICTIGIMDLSLIKLVDGTTQVSVGDKVKFVIKVANQGTLNAGEVIITDYIPSGYTFNALDNPNWTSPVNGKTSTSFLTLEVGDTKELSIYLTVNSTAGTKTNDLTNAAEISYLTDEYGNVQEDEDSTPDNENGDPVVDRIGSEDHVLIDFTADDEDDHDIAITTLKPNVCALTVDVVSTPADCNLSNGKIVANANGGSSPYTYSWSNGASGNSINAGAGTYELTVTDSKSCSEVVSGIKVEENCIPACNIQLAITSTDADCFGLNGKISVVASNGIAPYTYKWNTGSTNSTITNLVKGKYTVTVTDAAGCTKVAKGIEVEIDCGNICDINVIAYLTNPTCLGNDGKITTTITGGVGPYSFAWNTGSAAQNLSNLIAGTYSVTVSDSQGCSESATITLINPICKFDLALVKKLANGQASSVKTNDNVTFTITVFNQGEVPAYNVEVTDFVPSGLQLADNNWTLSAGKAKLNNPIAVIGVGQSANVNVTFKVTATTAGKITNLAEISKADDDTNPNNTPPTDVDSKPDDNAGNDPFGGDDVTNNNNGDEDDSDPADIIVTPLTFDLALVKKLANGQAASVKTNDNVTFTITVFNQGEVPAYNVEVTDFVPSGLQLADNNWTLSAGKAKLNNPIAVIGVGQSANVNVTFKVTATAAGKITNLAEISKADDDTNPNNTPPTDVDSKPDDNAGNDPFGGDDVTNNNNGDEDDSDPADIIVTPLTFDLALVKKLANGQAASVKTNDNVTFTITVFNQGEVPAYNVEVTDFIPSGLQLADNNWTLSAGKAKLNNPIAVIGVGQSANVNVTFKVTATTAGKITNLAEISKADDDTNPNNTPPTDVDSKPDDNAGNDPFGGDDVTNNNNGDEDDSDPADIIVTPLTFDLALVKKLANGQASSVKTNDNVTFTITVFNQGEVPAYNVEVTDFVPSGLQLADNNWTLSAGKAKLNNPIAVIGVGQSANVNVTFKVTATTAGKITNLAEISKADDDTNPNNTPPTDVDSKPDDNAGNDPFGGDDVTNNNNGDEDDSDPADIIVTPLTFDLALVKKLANGQAASVKTNDNVTFTITVFNQGEVPAYNVEVTDFVPSGLQLADNNWTLSAGKAKLNNPIAVIGVGQSANVNVTFKVTATTAGKITNLAEISKADDDTNPNNTPPTDVDSKPDDNAGNDPFGGDDVTNNNNGDEDDSDPADIIVTPLTFDLALIKTLAPGQSKDVTFGENVTFAIKVFNQGEVPAYNVQVTDYIPLGLQLVDNNWTATGANATLNNLISVIQPGQNVTVNITFKVTATQPGQITNKAEISKYDDDNNPNTPPLLNDKDSNPDNNPNNDVIGGNDVTDNSNGDEDDHDLEIINIKPCPPVLVGLPKDATLECDDPMVKTPANVTVQGCCSPIVSLKETIIPGNCPQSYTLIRVWTATDNCGGKVTGQQVIVVNDTKAPSLMFNNPLFAGMSNGDTLKVQCGQEPVFNASDFKTVDNCDPNPKVKMTDLVIINEPCIKLVRCVVTSCDACGNATTLVFYIQIADKTAPVFNNCPANITLDCSSNIPAPAKVTATDNCDFDVQIMYTESTAPGSCPQEKTITRKWTAIDDCGNVSTCTQIIKVQDKTAPVITINKPGYTNGGSITVECGGAIPTIINDDVTATDNCDKNIIAVINKKSINGNCLTEGFVSKDVYTITATDACGNIATYTFTIIVTDTKAPVLQAAPANITLNCGDAIPAAANLSATDVCDNNVSVVVNEKITNGNCPGNYNILRTWVATDDCGNTASVSQTIKVEDKTAPVFGNVPADVTINCDAMLPAPANPAATDKCDPSVDVTFKEQKLNGSCPQAYSLIRTWTATDDCGNTAVATQKITVVDTQAPVIVGTPNDVTIECDQPVTDPGNVKAADNCDSNPQLVYSVMNIPGACKQAYTIIRTWKATDACGNMSTKTQKVSVVDSKAPVFTSVPASVTIECSDPVPGLGFDVTAIDNCDQKVDVTFKDVTTPGNCENNYTITRTFTAFDDCGNMNTAIQTITVKDTKAPVLGAIPVDLTIECNEAVPAPANVTAIDNCDNNVAITSSDATSGNNCLKVVTRTYKAEDNCGNTATKVQKITLKDTKAPVAMLMAPLTGVPSGTTFTFNCDEAPMMDETTVQFKDNCDQDVPTVFTEKATIGDCKKDGYIIFLECTWTGTDDCGNSSSYTIFVKIIDTKAPVIANCPQDLTIECTDNVPAAGVVTATDNCDKDVKVTMSEKTLSGPCPQAKVIERTFTAEDDCGNTSTCKQTITVVDTKAPIIIGVPANITVECNAIPAVPNLSTIKAADDCDTNPSITFNETTETGKCPYKITRTWTAVDGCGNSTIRMQVITVIDNSAPVLSGIPADITIDLDKGQTIPGLPNVTASDNCDKNVQIDFSVTKDTVLCDVTMVRKWVATDDCGNVTIKTQKITILKKCPCIEPVIDDVIVTDAGCGMNNGKVEIKIGNGASNYEFIWTPNLGTTMGAGNIKMNLPPGSYSVIINYAKSVDCYKKLTINIKGGAADIIPEKELTIANKDCDQPAKVCLGVNLLDAVNFDIYDNGIKYNGQLSGCNIDTTMSYTYATIPGQGNTGPYVMESWTVGGNTFTGEFANIAGLVTLMNSLDPQGNWTQNTQTLSIMGGKKGISYGQLKVKQKNGSGKATLDINTQLLPNGTTLNLNTGAHKVVFVSKTSGCTDTVNIKVFCLNSSVENVTVQVGKGKKVCIDNSQLQGTPVSITNVCGNLSGEFSTLAINQSSYCIDITGVEVGYEKACIVVCDNFGFCDTTYININITPTVSLKPIAIDDHVNAIAGKLSTVKVLTNDVYGEGVLDMYLVTKPSKGLATIIANQVITVQPEKDQCEPMQFEYAICNEYGCDTATVYVNVACNNLVFNNGLTPNNDGLNDVFFIEGIDKYPNNKLTVFNRWGNKVYNVDKYKNDWGGQWENSILPDGTYFYMFEDGEGVTHSGYLQILR